MSFNSTLLAKVILNSGCKCEGYAWSSNIQTIFNEIYQEHIVASKLQVSINSCCSLFHEIQCKQWSVQ